MNDFMSKLAKTASEKYNISVTENGAVGNRTTGSTLVDIHFAVSSLRNASDQTVCAHFSELYAENKLLAVKWLFFVSDVRGGLGERRLFRVCMAYIANNDKALAVKLLPLVAEYTRWDNLVFLLDTPVCDEAVAIIKAQLDADLAAMNNDKPVSLLAKWLPSVNAAKQETVRLARLLCTKLEMTAAQYRKTLSALRAHSKVTEVLMSGKQWTKISYSAVPSRANLLYRNAFLTRDTKRRKAFLARLAAKQTKINADVLYPHDIISQYRNYMGDRWTTKKCAPDETIEQLWKALPDYVNGASGTLCVSDGSGSMYGPNLRGSHVAPIDVAVALTIYFSEHCTGQFANRFITFSATPQVVDLSRQNTLLDKLFGVLLHDEVANTNIEAVFDLILDTAVKHKLPQEELPKTILVLSDMEFDSCTRDKNGKRIDADRGIHLFETIRKRYRKQGYILPRLVFWNICSRTNTIPLTKNKAGVALVSGFSPVTAKMVLSEQLDPLGVILEQLESERYAPVEQAVLSALE